MSTITKTKQEITEKAAAVEAVLLPKLTERFGEKKEWRFDGHKLLISENSPAEYPIALILYVSHVRLTDLAADQEFHFSGIKNTIAWAKELGLLDGSVSIHMNADPSDVENMLAQYAAAVAAAA